HAVFRLPLDLAVKPKLSSRSESKAFVITQKALDEVFPSNPLKQVAFEIRFPRNLRVISDLSHIQERLGHQFIVSGPETLISPGEQSAIVTYNFSNPKDNLLIKVGEDRYAIIFTKYQKFEIFKAKTLKL